MFKIDTQYFVYIQILLFLSINYIILFLLLFKINLILGILLYGITYITKSVQPIKCIKKTISEF